MAIGFTRCRYPDGISTLTTFATPLKLSPNPISIDPSLRRARYDIYSKHSHLYSGYKLPLTVLRNPAHLRYCSRDTPSRDSAVSPVWLISAFNAVRVRTFVNNGLFFTILIHRAASSSGRSLVNDRFSEHPLVFILRSYCSVGHLP
jgi:hypothetical protein